MALTGASVTVRNKASTSAFSASVSVSAGSWGPVLDREHRSLRHACPVLSALTRPALWRRLYRDDRDSACPGAEDHRRIARSGQARQKASGRTHPDLPACRRRSPFKGIQHSSSHPQGGGRGELRGAVGGGCAVARLWWGSWRRIATMCVRGPERGREEVRAWCGRRGVRGRSRWRSGGR